MDCAKMTIRIDDDYLTRLNKARYDAEIIKCRSWVDPQKLADPSVQVDVTPSCITLRYRSQKGPTEESAAYDSVLSLTEMRNGVLLRLSHKRLLFLPVMDNADANEALMHAVTLLCEYCPYSFRDCRLRLPGVSPGKKLTFHTRPRQGLYTGSGTLKVFLFCVICISVFIGSVFVSMLFQNHKITPEEAIVFSDEYTGYEKAVRRYHTHYINLQFADSQEQYLDGFLCSDALVKQLDQIPAGTPMNLLIHPTSGSIMQIEVQDTILLHFDSAMSAIRTNSITFACLGLLMFGGAVILVFEMLPKNRRRKWK